MDKTRWVRDESRFGDNEIHCEKCGSIIDYDYWLKHIFWYCYHCGAKVTNALSFNINERGYNG